MYKSPQIIRATGGSAEKPLVGPNGKAVNQPKPHSSNRIVQRCYMTSNGKLITAVLRIPPNGRP